MVLLISGRCLPARYGTQYPRSSVVERDPAVDPVLRESFAARRPQTVLLGNSMVGEGVDEQLFAALVPGQAYKLGLNGAASAAWYLIVKNVICAAEHPPRRVVLFFRDTFLTYPDYRVDGKYWTKVERYAGPDEELLDRLAYLDGMPWLSYQAARWLPLYGEREKLRDEIVGTAKFGLPQHLMGRDSTAVEQAIARTFADSNLNQELLTAVQLEAEDLDPVQDHFDFATRCEKSFLPAIVDLLAAHEIELVMVRLKRRGNLQPAAAGNDESVALAAYTRDLAAYLSERGVAWLDYTQEPSLTAEHFGEGDHLNEEGREVFTRLVAADLPAAAAPTGGGR